MMAMLRICIARKYTGARANLTNHGPVETYGFPPAWPGGRLGRKVGAGGRLAARAVRRDVHSHHRHPGGEPMKQDERAADQNNPLGGGYGQGCMRGREVY